MTEQGKKTKRLPRNVKSFTANGNKYYIQQMLSVERWRYFEDYQPLVGLGRSFQDIFDQNKKAYEFLNAGKYADAAVVLHNIMIGVKEKLEERHDPALMLCALFINREGEDERTFDLEFMKDKILDWQKEGYAMADFFSLAFKLVPFFTESYEDVIQGISDRQKKAK